MRSKGGEQVYYLHLSRPRSYWGLRKSGRLFRISREIQTRDRVGWDEAGREKTKPTERGVMERRVGKERCKAIYIYTDLAHPPIKGWGNLAAKRANHTFRDNAPPKGETTLQDIQPQNLQTLKPPNLNTLKPKTAKLTTHKKTTKLGTSTR